MCPKVAAGVTCPRGDVCTFAHNLNEVIFHAAKYRTLWCENEFCRANPNSKDNVCAYCHTISEYRATDAGRYGYPWQSQNYTAVMNMQQQHAAMMYVDPSMSLPQYQMDQSMLAGAKDIRDVQQQQPLQQLQQQQMKPQVQGIEDASFFAPGGKADAGAPDFSNLTVPPALAPKVRFCSSYPNVSGCRRGDQCAFAHNREEIATPLLLVQEEEQDAQWMTEEFFTLRFKTIWCPIGVQHDWQNCVYAHNYQDARRNPSIGYGPKPCPTWKRKETALEYSERCPNGIFCPYSHGAKEQLYHPGYYKTVTCQDAGKCPRTDLCAFFHSKCQQRSKLPASERDYSYKVPISEERVKRNLQSDFLTSPFRNIGANLTTGREAAQQWVSSVLQGGVTPTTAVDSDEGGSCAGDKQAAFQAPPPAAEGNRPSKRRGERNAIPAAGNVPMQPGLVRGGPVEAPSDQIRSNESGANGVNASVNGGGGQVWGAVPTAMPNTMPGTFFEGQQVCYMNMGMTDAGGNEASMPPFNLTPIYEQSRLSPMMTPALDPTSCWTGSPMTAPVISPMMTAAPNPMLSPNSPVGNLSSPGASPQNSPRALGSPAGIGGGAAFHFGINLNLPGHAGMMMPPLMGYPMGFPVMAPQSPQGAAVPVAAQMQGAELQHERKMSNSSAASAGPFDHPIQVQSTFVHYKEASDSDNDGDSQNGGRSRSGSGSSGGSRRRARSQ
eukprot:TRINITY_DN9803_c0_g2_i1.p1 TRINITY_DN9803_c0_g2~~TRINITY_DN9803_c0_g2_i1.p1  ORF type:complete len:830 (-),score=141.35 TRINITY_DN9803_c0_g2_i1:172-2331(-)